MGIFMDTLEDSSERAGIVIGGLYDYLYAVHLETHGEVGKAAKHLERASAQLGPFPTLLAHTVRATIAYKLNWYHRLENVPYESMFYPLGAFFTKTYDEIVNLAVSGSQPAASKVGVHVDDFHFVYRKAVVHFMSKNPELLEKCIAVLQGVMDRGSLLHREKYELLEARYYRMIGEPVKAMYSYGSLNHHPFYAGEIGSMKASR